MTRALSTTVEAANGEIIIRVSGVIDMATAERLRDAIEPHMGPRQAIVLDLSGVEFTDSSLLRVLVQARGTLTADGGSLVLRNPSESARRLLTAAGVEVLLDDEADQVEQG
jgi:anti-sigma B factor antagonist